MWKQSSADVKQTIRRSVLYLFGVVALAVVSCTTDATPFVEPTLTLIPATATPTPSPVTPTQPAPSLPAPADLVLNTPPADPTEAITTQDETLQTDPVAAELVALAQRRVAQDLGLPTRRIRLVEVSAYAWNDTSLGCPLPGEVYTPLIVDGYRIVLTAGEQEYIFHTDFDRVIACDAANEQLPESTPEATPEVNE
jgi:hypothetical protein